MTSNPAFRFIVDLPASVARRAMAAIDDPSTPYEELGELIAVAVENQLRLDLSPDTSVALSEELPINPPGSAVDKDLGKAGETTEGQAPPSTTQASSGRSVARARKTQGRPPKKGGRQPARTASRKQRPEAHVNDDDLALLALPTSSPDLVADPEVADRALSSFTNRLTPLVVASRVLVNLIVEQGAASAEDLHRFAPPLARAAGLRIKADDEQAGRRGRRRRWTGWPVGDDEVASLARFRKSFLFALEGSKPAGVFFDLGLAAVDKTTGQLVPTTWGVTLGATKTPLLDADDGLLATEQQAALRGALLANVSERHEIASFLAAVTATGGIQSLVDASISESHQTWSEAQVVAHRAALTGRLRDIDVIDIGIDDTANEPVILPTEHAEPFVHSDLKDAE
ncbi:MAG: hypothetical protein M3355_04235 [Actinomycetota bacterium]|nr:hypothetical protein [Actinomycetota bacterium]